MPIDQQKITYMREGGQILADILREVLSAVKPGIKTQALDDLALSLCEKHKVKPAFKGYRGFPAVLCVGINEVVVHGIPGDVELKAGDIISVDIGLIHKKVYLDMARTVGVGKISRASEVFLRTAERALENATKQAIVGNTIGDIGHAIQSTVEAFGYSVVREMVGHTIGYKLHENLLIPGYGEKNTGAKLSEGQTLAIEAIINQGGREIVFSREDGWTTTTKDGMLSALFENTVLVGRKPEILTPL